MYMSTTRPLIIALYEAWSKPGKADEWRAKLQQTETVEQWKITSFRSWKTPWFSGDIMTPKCLHRCQIWRLIEVPNLKILPKNECFFINIGLNQTDQPIPYRARSNRTNPSADHRWAIRLVIETPNDSSAVQSNRAFVTATRHKNS